MQNIKPNFIQNFLYPFPTQVFKKSSKYFYRKVFVRAELRVAGMERDFPWRLNIHAISSAAGGCGQVR